MPLIYVPDNPSLFTPFLYSLLCLCLIKCSVSIHSGLQPCLLNFLHVRMDCSCTSKRSTLKIYEPFWFPLPSRAVFHRIIRRSMNNSKDTFLNIKVCSSAVYLTHVSQDFELHNHTVTAAKLPFLWPLYNQSVEMNNAAWEQQVQQSISDHLH